MLTLPTSKHSIGREMTTGTNNKVVCNNNITPDIVVQKSSSEGYVVEVKCGLPKNKDHWKDKVTQFIKYDDQELKGWWTETEFIKSINLVGLLHQSRAMDFYDFFMRELADRGITLENRFAIIQYNREIRVHTFINLQIIQGEIMDEALNQRLRSSIAVPIEKVISNPDYKDLKFYDVQPRVEYVMYLLWQDLFPEKNAIMGENNEDSKSNEFLVSASELTNDLQRAYGNYANESREKSFPRIDWIKSALDMFVDIDLATKHNDDEYTVYYKDLRKKDVIEEFAERIAQLKEGKSEELDTEQLELFDEENLK
jgi:hypothetical protein